MRLVLIGAPGSGKGTQAEKLSSYFKIKAVSLGDILRGEVKNNTDLGKKVEKYMLEGVLVPDEVVAEVIDKNLSKQGFILDGFPRNLQQVEMLDKILANKGISLDKVIYFDVSQQKVIERLSGRRICKNCGALYHIKTMPPRKEGICDKCGGELIMRKDDNEDTIRKRWQVFIENSLPMVEYYRDKGILLEINAEFDKEKVFEDIVNSLKN